MAQRLHYFLVNALPIARRRPSGPL